MDITPQRRFAEDASVVLAGMGLPPAYGKLLGWLLVCDPPDQTGTEIAAALGLSKGSASTGLRMLEASRLVRRVPRPGRRGNAYEVTPNAFASAAVGDQFRAIRELMERGLDALGAVDAPVAERLRYFRDFYAFVEREMPLLIERFMREHKKEGQSDG